MQGSSILPFGEVKESFTMEPFVHPLVLKRLSTEPSGAEAEIAAIRLVKVGNGGYYDEPIRASYTEGIHKPPMVSCEYDEPPAAGRSAPFFVYRLIGVTPAGVHALETRDYGGGTLVSVSLLFVVIERDGSFTEVMRVPGSRGAKTEKVYDLRPKESAILLRKLGEFSLGDRWSGDLRVEGHSVFISPNQGWYAHATGATHAPEYPEGELRLPAVIEGTMRPTGA